MRVIVNTYPVAFACPGGGEIQLLKTEEHLIAQGIDVIRFNPWSPSLHDADLVHFFSCMGGSYNFHAYLIKHSIPYVVSSILWPDDVKKFPISEIKYILSNAALIFPNSQAEAQIIADKFQIPFHKFHVTHNGVDEIFLQQNTSPQLAKQTFNLPEQFILSVGNIEPRKNQVLMIKAAKRLGLPLVIAGHIRDQQYFEQVREFAPELLSYLGPVPHASELQISLYRACSVFVLPSFYETPGLAALEAAAVGAPIVITSVGATQEYFDNHALYCSPDSEQELIAGIKYQLAHQNQDRTAQINFIQRYGWDQVAKQVIAGYQKVVEVAAVTPQG